MIGIGIGIFSPKKQNHGYLPSAAQNFIDRVELAGGTVEAVNCLVKSLYQMGYNESNYTISQAFYTRVEEASGEVENKPCFENTLDELL